MWSKEWGVVNISTKILNKILTTKFSFILGFLVRNKIIERRQDNKYLVNDHSYMYKISKQYIHKKYRRDLITKESDFTLYKKLNSNIDLSDDLKKFILQNLEKIELNFSTCTANLTLRLIDKPSEKHAELNTEDPAKSDFPDRIKKVTKELFHSISQKYVFT
ncbi:MAG TPA: hypothetical protein P5556_10725, partial [Candidatus Gastranaerophilales bacterium]|nr:hypothetical protein [Candidatus Gastranaerophilales bacterium]